VTDVFPTQNMDARMGVTEQEAMLRRLTQAVETWGIGVFEHTFSTGETWASPRFREMLGFGPDEYVSMKEISRQIFPADEDSVRAALLAAGDPDGDGIFDMIYRVFRKRDGAVRWLHGRGQTIFSERDGRRAPVSTIGTIMDVTEQEELRIAVERHELRLSEAMAVSQLGIFDWDHDPARPEDAIYWSPNFRQMVGFDQDAAPDLPWYLAQIHPDDRQAFEEALSKSLTCLDRCAAEVQFRWLHPDGGTRWFLARSTTSVRRKGDVTAPKRTVGAMLDVTSTMQAAAELSQRSEILEATPDIVCVFDPELRLVFLNQAGRTFAGLPESPEFPESTSRTLSDVTGKEFAERFQREGQAISLQTGSWQIEMILESQRSEPRPVSALVLCHLDKQGGLTHFSLVARDLTHEKRLEEQFRQAQKMEVIGRLAGGVAHDFNNVLSIIMGFSDVLEDKVRSGEGGLEEIEEIRFAAERAASLTRQLLSMSRKELVQPRSVDMGSLVEAAIPMFQRLIDATITIHFTQVSAPALVKADPTQIEQVLLNLVVNARDAMPQGGELQLDVSQIYHRPETAPKGLTLEPGTYTVLSVSDSGHGMSEETRARIFEPFFTTKGAGKGTGLGLSTVFDIVEKWRGGIWVHSEPGKGTTFKIYVPAVQEAEPVSPELPSAPIAHPGGTILLVDDEPQLRSLLTTILTRAGYRVLEATGPIEALGLAKEFEGHIDLLLTDVVMPQMTGPFLATEIKNFRPATAVLFMSGYTEDAVVRRGLIDERLSFISKPLSAGTLLRKVAQVLQGRSSRVA
jgi:two-component system cell cycle sensor histidine kinase/response regulator CckA